MFVHSRRRRRRGFTLMEVLLVLAILVVLGSLVTVSYVRIQAESNKKSALAQITMLEDAVNLYTLGVGSPPNTLEDLLIAPAELPVGKWAGPYLEKCQLPVDPWNNQFVYELVQDPLNPETYKARISSNGPNGAPGDTDDIVNAL
mgnify:CR=1 FL=1